MGADQVRKGEPPPRAWGEAVSVWLVHPHPRGIPDGRRSDLPLSGSGREETQGQDDVPHAWG